MINVLLDGPVSVPTAQETLDSDTVVIMKPLKPVVVQGLEVDAILLVDEDGMNKQLPYNTLGSLFASQTVLGSCIILMGHAAQEGWTWE